MIDAAFLPVACLVAGFFLFAVAFQAWAAEQDARAERALHPPPVVGRAAAHPLPSVAPMRTRRYDVATDSYPTEDRVS